MNKIVFSISFIISLNIVLTGCYNRNIKLSPYELKLAKSVEIIDKLPQKGENCDFFGIAKAFDGEGFGDMGTKGNREQALEKLKVNIAKKQANKAIISKEVTPHFSYGLNPVFDNHYQVEAYMYFCRKISDSDG